MEQVHEKNIQPSEKIEYLLSIGQLKVLVKPTHRTLMFVCKNLDIVHMRNSIRMVDFVNEIMEQYNMYPMVQKYLLSIQNKEENYESIQSNRNKS